jgi:hypothetical protein
MAKSPQPFEMMEFGDGDCAPAMDCLGAFVEPSQPARLLSAKYHKSAPKPLKRFKTIAELRSLSDRLKESPIAVPP